MAANKILAIFDRGSVAVWTTPKNTLTHLFICARTEQYIQWQMFWSGRFK